MSDKILIVDDNEINLKLLEQIIINHTSHKVILARNGQQAIDLAKEHDPFIIFMDMMMPEVNGYVATREIKSMQQFELTPVVAITAVNTREGIKEVFDCGCEDILPKPIEVQTVVNIINKYFKSRVTSQS